MISRQLDVNKCLTKVALYDAKLEKIKTIKNVDHLVGVLEQSANQQQALLLRRHLKDKITHMPKAKSRLLVKYLSIIAAVLNDQVESKQLGVSAKVTVLDKLTEGLVNCGAGYLDRVYQIMGSLNQYESIDDLLCAYRLQLVEKAYHSTNSDEVHLHHRFHVVANGSGLGIPYQDVEDPYTGGMTDASIRQSLESVFQSYYTPKAIMRHFWQQAPIYQLGYVGPKDGLGYAICDFEAMLHYFRKLFNNPELTLTSCFKINKETGAVTDIHWASVNTMLFNYFVDNDYFNLPNKSKVIKATKGHRSVRLEYSRNGIENAILRYKGLGKTRFVGFVDAEDKSLVESINQDLLHELLGKVEAVCENAPALRVKNLYQAGLVSFDFAFPRLVAGIKRGDDFVTLTTDLSDQEVELVFDVVKDQISFKFESAQKLTRFLQRLSEQQLTFLMQQSAFLLALKAIIADFVANKNFVELFKAISQEKVAILFDELALGLLMRTSKTADMIAVINVLPEEVITRFFALDMLRSGPIAADDFRYMFVLNRVAESKRAAVASFMFENFKRLNLQKKHLESLFKLSSDRVIRRFIQQQITSLPNSLIKSADDFVDVMQGLSQRETKEIYNELLECAVPFFPELVVDTYSFRQLMSYLNSQQRKELYSEVADRLLPIIIDIESASNVSKFLDKEEKDRLFELILPVFTNSQIVHRDDFASLIRGLSLEQCRRLFSQQFINVQVQHHQWSFDKLSWIIGNVGVEKSVLLMLQMKGYGIRELQNVASIRDIIRHTDSNFRRKIIESILPDSSIGQRQLLAREYARRVRDIYGHDYRGLSNREARFFKAYASGWIIPDELISVMALSVEPRGGSDLISTWYSVLRLFKTKHASLHAGVSGESVVQPPVSNVTHVLPMGFTQAHGYPTSTFFSPVGTQAAATHSQEHRRVRKGRARHAI